MEISFTVSTFLALLGAAVVFRFVIIRRPIAMFWVFLFAAAYLLLFAALGGDDYELLLIAFVSCGVLRIGGTDYAVNVREGRENKSEKGTQSNSSQQPRSSYSPTKSSVTNDNDYPQEHIEAAVSEVVEGRQEDDSWRQARATAESKNLQEVESEYIKHRVEQLKRKFPLTTAERIQALEAALDPLLSDTNPTVSSDGFDEKYPKKYLEVAMLEVISGKTKTDSWNGARSAMEADNLQDIETEYIKLRVEQQKQAEEKTHRGKKRD